MIQGLYVTSQGMIPRITQLDNVSNNLANAATNGYKKSDVFLRELITAQGALDNAMGNERTEVSEEVWVDFIQGDFEETDSVFDVALNGSGFFRVRDADGTILYTRDGRFQQDPFGFLMNEKGMYLLDNRNMPVQVNGNNFIINGNGDVSVDGEYTQSIGLAEFAPGDYQQLQNLGSGLFAKPAAVNEIMANPATQFRQGYLEDSNVEPVTAMVDMIEIHRAFELGQRAIQIQDGTLQRTVTELGVVR